MPRPALAPLAGSVALVIALVACGADEDAATTPTTAASGASTPEGTADGASSPEGTADGGSIPELTLVPASTVPVPEVDTPESIPTELVVTEITPGSGKAAADGDLVYVNYVGVRSEDGTQFDTNFGGEPLTVTLGAGGVIEGWDKGLVGAMPGERLQLDIPNDLAYKDAAQGEIIKAGDALTFVIDVLAVVAPVDPAGAPTAAELPLSPELTGPTEAVDLRVGDGATLEAGGTGIFHLVAVRADDGTVLQTTWEATPVPATLVEGALIEQMIEGLPGMKVGGRRLVRVPSSPDMDLTPETDIFIVSDLFAIY